MDADQAYAALLHEIDRVLPEHRASVLAQPLAQLQQQLGEGRVAPTTLDLLEDLLESLLREAGWPS